MSLSNLFAKLFGRSAAVVAQEPAAAPTTVEAATAAEETPKFLLPETAQAYQALLAQEEARCAALLAPLLAQEQDLRERSRAAREAAARETGADQPAAARRALAEQEANYLSRQADERAEACRRAAGKWLTEPPTARFYECGDSIAQQVEKTCRAAEMLDILVRGERLACSPVQVARGMDKAERRLVRFANRYFVGVLRMPMKLRDTGRKELVWGGNPYNPEPKLEVPVYEPTGEFDAPVAEWVTDSLSQFKREELEILAAQKS